MSEVLTALEVCCCGNCETAGHPKETIRPLTAEEIADREASRADYLAREAAQAAAATTLAALKTSAKAKLVAGTPLTEAEAATIVL